MQEYQLEYIENCKSFLRLTNLPPFTGGSFDEDFRNAMDNMHAAGDIEKKNTALLQEKLLPVLDELYQQDRETLLEMESFADALAAGPRALDIALADQIYSALLSVTRRSGKKEDLIRGLYKLGMARFAMWNMLTGLDHNSTESFSSRMRYCFAEASGYLKYFDEFDNETKSFILRSSANMYIGDFESWRDKLAIVRRSMRIFQDKRYRDSAPNLPWDRFMDSLHRQMVSVIPKDLTNGFLSPDEVVDVMESAHLIYELQYEDAQRSGKPILASRITPYYSVEYACGLLGANDLLTHFELLMDDVDLTNYDDDTLYRVISMPAFYSQYLSLVPDLLPAREAYLTKLYDRLVKYVTAMPVEDRTERARLYMRQMVSVFVELPGGISYRDFATTMMTCFAPDIYSHGYAVGREAALLAEAILGAEANYFDDIPEIAKLPAEKKMDAAKELAKGAGLMHDIGKLNFTTLYAHSGRQMLRIEDMALRLHAETGSRRLAKYASTRIFADSALGHHRWYDGSDGFPDGYVRAECETRAMVDIVAFADYLESEGADDLGVPHRHTTFEEKIEEAVKLGGRRFSPLVTGALQDAELLAGLRDIFDNGRREGYYYCALNAARRSK